MLLLSIGAQRSDPAVNGRPRCRPLCRARAPTWTIAKDHALCGHSGQLQRVRRKGDAGGLNHTH